MSLYHIKIATKSSKKIIYIYDLTKDKVVNDYLRKYLNKVPFFADGYNLNYENIIQFKIVETEKTIKETNRSARELYHRQGIAAFFSDESLLDSREFSKEVTQEMINEICGDGQTVVQATTINSKRQKHVFIVHGRDRSKVEEVENFVRSIGFSPIVLFKEADNGLTIIEKIEKYTSTACFGIVIYTECDIGYLIGCQDNARPRARQNVVFEHGYLMAKLGRSNVCALVEDPNIEMPSDISGIVYKNYDSAGLWKYSIAKDMIASGIEVDLNSIK